VVALAVWAVSEADASSKELHWACSVAQHHTEDDAGHHNQEATVQVGQPCAARGVTGGEGEHSAVLQSARSGAGPHHLPHIQPWLGVRRSASTSSQPVVSPGACTFLGSSAYSRHSFCIQGTTRVTAALSQSAFEAIGKKPR